MEKKTIIVKIQIEDEVDFLEVDYEIKSSGINLLSSIPDFLKAQIIKIISKNEQN